MGTAVVSCKHDKLQPEPAVSGYPENVERIVVAKCATAGCHNETSKEAAAGLSLETWDAMFEGSRGGAVVIPYRPDFSTIIYYTNVYDEYGLIHAEPLMPYDADTLTMDEVGVLYNWVVNGAPNADGLVKYANEPDRQKFYVVNQMCDMATVFDASTMLATRFVDVGNSPVGIEMPRAVAVTPDNLLWGTCVAMGQNLQLFRTSDNTIFKEINITAGGWSNLAFSANGNTAYVADKTNGRVGIVNLDDETVNIIDGLMFPSGLAENLATNVLYVTGKSGNYIYKLPLSDPSNWNQVSLNGMLVSNDSSLNIHQVVFSNDGSKYYVTCEYSNEVRVVKTSNDSVMSVIAVGAMPQMLAALSEHPYLFVSCQEDITSFPGKRGSVQVIDLNTNQVISKIQTGHQPYGFAVDETHNRMYVTNRNVKPGGPTPHHDAACSGRNGYVTAININTLQLIDGFKAEVSVDPYSIGITH